jgi:nitroreductase
MTGLPAEEAARLLEAVPVRRARRSYTGEAVDPGTLDALAALAEQWRPWSSARCIVIREAPASLFMGVVGAYGGISKAPSAIAFVSSDPYVDEAVGYIGEGLVLAATARGLDTCWVAGVFSPIVVRHLLRLGAGERVPAVSALGHAIGERSLKERVLHATSHRRGLRTLEDLAPGIAEWPGWARAAVAAAQLAPSAMNRQPWRFMLEDGSLVVHYHGGELPRASKRLDCGIAMLHAELGAFGEGVRGTWELLPSPRVARFTPGL